MRRASRRLKVAGLCSPKSTPVAARTRATTCASRRRAGRGRRRRLAPGEVRVAGQPGQLGAERRQGQAEVDHAGVDRALGHLPEARRARVLGEGDPAVRPDRREPGGAVGGGAGEDHADGLPAALGRQRSEEEVDGEVRPALVLLEPGELQRALLDRHLDAGRDDVHPVRLDPHRPAPPARPSWWSTWASASLSRLARVASRCCTRTSAMPESGGTWARSCRKASRPPAEAPTPTTGKEAGGDAGRRGASGTARSGRSLRGPPEDFGRVGMRWTLSDGGSGPCGGPGSAARDDPMVLRSPARCLTMRDSRSVARSRTFADVREPGQWRWRAYPARNLIWLACSGRQPRTSR